MKKNLVLFPKIILTLLFFLNSCKSNGQDDRESWQPPDKIMDAVGVKPGMIIGEAGAGNGYFTIPLAKRVGNNGKIYANDISKRSLDELEVKSKKAALKNIQIVLGETEDPLFPEKDLDMIIMVYVLHHLDKPIKFTENLVKYLKPDAPLIIIEKNTNVERAHPPSFMTKEQILETMQKTSFKLEKVETFLQKDNIYIFNVKN